MIIITIRPRNQFVVKWSANKRTTTVGQCERRRRELLKDENKRSHELQKNSGKESASVSVEGVILRIVYVVDFGAPLTVHGDDDDNND